MYTAGNAGARSSVQDASSAAVGGLLRVAAVEMPSISWKSLSISDTEALVGSPFNATMPQGSISPCKSRLINLMKVQEPDLSICVTFDRLLLLLLENKRIT